jgi:hypothetical protein
MGAERRGGRHSTCFQSASGILFRLIKFRGRPGGKSDFWANFAKSDESDVSDVQRELSGGAAVIWQ